MSDAMPLTLPKIVNRSTPAEPMVFIVHLFTLELFPIWFLLNHFGRLFTCDGSRGELSQRKKKIENFSIEIRFQVFDDLSCEGVENWDEALKNWLVEGDVQMFPRCLPIVI